MPSHPYGTTLKYFLLDGNPAVMESDRRVPRVLRGGKWEPLYDTYRFHHEADPVSEAEFNAAVAEASQEAAAKEAAAREAARANPGIQLAADDWERQPGPRSQNRWVHTKTGRVIYSETNPGAPKEGKQQSAGKVAPDQGQPDAKPAAKQPKPTVDEVHAHISSIRGKATAEHVRDLADRLGRMTVREIGELKQRLGVKASGAKAALVKAVAERALAAEGSKPTAKPAAAKPAKAPKPTVDELHQHIQGLRGKATAEDVQALPERLAQMTVKELGELKQRLGVKASGAKAAQVKAIAERALAQEQEQAKPAPTPAPKRPTPAAKPADHGAAILAAAHALDPRLKDGAPVVLSDLRKRVPGLSKREFDAAVLRLSGEGKAVLHRYDHPGHRTPEELSRMVQDERGENYHLLAMRTDEPTDAPSPAKPAPASGKAFSAADHMPDLMDAVVKHGADHGGLADLADVRESMPHLTRPQQDAVINLARKHGLLTGSGYEGRHGITERQKAAHLPEEGSPGVGYLSVKGSTPAPAAKPAPAPEKPAAKPKAGDHDAWLGHVAATVRRLGNGKPVDIGDLHAELAKDQPGLTMGMVQDDVRHLLGSGGLEPHAWTQGMASLKHASAGILHNNQAIHHVSATASAPRSAGKATRPDTHTAPADSVREKVVQAVREAKAANAFSRPTIQSVYDRIRADHPDLTLGQFRDILTDMNRDRTIRTIAYTQGLASIPRGNTAFNVDREYKHYLDLP